MHKEKYITHQKGHCNTQGRHSAAPERRKHSGEHNRIYKKDCYRDNNRSPDLWKHDTGSELHAGRHKPSGGSHILGELAHGQRTPGGILHRRSRHEPGAFRRLAEQYRECTLPKRTVQHDKILFYGGDSGGGLRDGREDPERRNGRRAGGSNLPEHETARESLEESQHGLFLF